MNTTTLVSGCAALSLADEEIGGLEAPDVLAPPTATPHYELIGRFLTDRAIKFDHMQQVLASVWRPVMGMKVLPIADDLFLFQFPHIKDLQRVLDDGPWSFENHTLVCDMVPTGTRPEEVSLNTIAIWVQIHDLPSIYASTEFIERIGNYVGVFLKADPNNFGGLWRSFFRIRVRLDVSAPLKRRMKMYQKDGSTQWISFKYERLGTFCFCCGVLGHFEKFCKKTYEEVLDPATFPYGGWMRAGSRRQARPVGARWLVADLPKNPVATDTPNPDKENPGVDETEECSGMQGDLKRRRAGDSAGHDVVMFETPKTSIPAGLMDQARPTQ
ncbi:PREDICTED: uncharacterized protein LOC109146666 [Ipomoea nil]|uniref:uncharacterized protein LOC109146666 n=1 Tax=Ipomoea nil TaxID=35883 RepID=UPI000901B583|nr:PREDICTED: uncharacterized protein LOC109146666 [Ipomoea nil]